MADLGISLFEARMRALEAERMRRAQEQDRQHQMDQWLLDQQVRGAEHDERKRQSEFDRQAKIVELWNQYAAQLAPNTQPTEHDVGGLQDMAMVGNLAGKLANKQDQDKADWQAQLVNRWLGQQNIGARNVGVKEGALDLKAAELPFKEAKNKREEDLMPHRIALMKAATNLKNKTANKISKSLAAEDDNELLNFATSLSKDAIAIQGNIAKGMFKNPDAENLAKRGFTQGHLTKYYALPPESKAKLDAILQTEGITIEEYIDKVTNSEEEEYYE